MLLSPFPNLVSCVSGGLASRDWGAARKGHEDLFEREHVSDPDLSLWDDSAFAELTT